MPAISQWIRLEDRLGYLVLPERAAMPLPSVLVVHDSLGVTEFVEDLARRIAAAGYATLAPDLYAVGGARPAAVTRERIAEAAAFMSSLPSKAYFQIDARESALVALAEPVGRRIRETLAQLAGFASPETQANSIALLRRAIGYLRSERPETRGQKVACLGEGLASLLACEEPELAGAAVFYGSVPPDDKLSRIRCPVIAFYGSEDTQINAGIAKLEHALRAACKSFEYNIYEGADHGFFNDTTSKYDVRASRDSYARLLSFFLRTLA
jgi:carboxymethylenebutenolidase